MNNDIDFKLGGLVFYLGEDSCSKQDREEAIELIGEAVDYIQYAQELIADAKTLFTSSHTKEDVYNWLEKASKIDV